MHRGPGTEPNVASNLSRFQRWAKTLAGALAVSKRTEITMETDHVLIIQRRHSAQGWCQECGCEVDMVGLAEAEGITGMTQPALQAGAQMQKWHISEDQDGSPLICLASLLRSR